MAKPEEVVWTAESHTLAKHAILRGYLSAWLPIMSKHNQRLVYIDGFAGPGVYSDGEPGSPIIALQTFLEHTHRGLITSELVYVFIEEDAGRVSRLKEEIAKLGEFPQQVVVGVIEGSFEDESSKVLDGVEKNGAHLAPTFAFIDPFGYAQAPMKLAERFLQFQRCEVLVYVPMPFVNRFLGREGQERALTNLFGTEDWTEALELEGAARLRFLHDLFDRELRIQCGLAYVRSFEIVSSSGQNTGYTLFFGTNHPLGLEKMKESMWRIDPIEGKRFKDTTTTGMQTLFDEEPDMTPLRDALIERFGPQDSFTIEEVMDFTITETPYLRSHVKKKTLKPLEEDGKLEILSTRKRKLSYPDGTRMRFSR